MTLIASLAAIRTAIIGPTLFFWHFQIEPHHMGQTYKPSRLTGMAVSLEQALAISVSSRSSDLSLLTGC